MIEDKITGIMIYYYFVCKRKLWYSYQNISMESDLFKWKKKIRKEIDEKIDSVIIFKSRNERWLEKDILGTEIADPQFI